MAVQKKTTASSGKTKSTGAKSSSKKSSPKKSSPKKSSSAKSSSAKSAGKTSSSPTDSTKQEGGTKAPSSRPRKARAPRAEPERRMTGSRVGEAAARQLAELTSKEIEGITALQRTDDGWQVELEVLELRRIPSTTDVLATYEVRVDTSGELEEYRRGQRYVRGQVEGDR